jgi:bacillithiol biosynthesis cysteine-adding enzyme BshC
MYTLLKAITTIQLARRVESQQRVPVVPIFWADAEDHDWAEIASCTILDADFKPRTLTLDAPDGAGEQSVGRLPLDARLERTLSDLTSAIPATVFTESVLAGIHEAYRPGRTMTEALALWIEGVLGRSGLVVYESSDPGTKPMVSRIFSQELRTAGRTAALATAAGQALSAIGHAAQVEPQPDQPALFYLDEARTPIRRDGDHFVIGNTPIAADDLIRQAEESPERFSPNVLLRSLVQDTIFPTACYVAGPSELAYLGQLGDVYNEFGVQRPLVYARATATIVDSAAARFLRRYPISFEAFQPQDESALNRMLQAQLPQSVEDAMRDASEALQRSMGRVVDALPDLDQTLSGAARTTLGKMQHDLDALRGKIIQAVKRRDETLRRQFTRVQTQAFPLGHPQERTLAVVYFLNQYGPGLVDRLLEELPLDMGQHWVIAV